MHPPGKRKNAGFKSASFCTRSARRPCGRFFHVCLRAERHQVEIDHARRRGDQLQRRMGLGRRRSQRRGDLRPLRAGDLHLGVGEQHIVDAHQPQVKLLGDAGLRSHPRGEVIRFPSADAHSAEAVVDDAVSRSQRRPSQFAR